MIAGCYTLDLYCRHQTIATELADAAGHSYREFPHQFTGPDETDCVRQARKKGWIFHIDKDVTCPHCAKKPRNAAPPEPEVTP